MNLNHILSALIIMVFVGIAFIGLSLKAPYTGYATYSEPVNKVEKYEDTESYIDKDCGQAAIEYTTEWGDTELSCLEKECDHYYQDCVERNSSGNCVKYTEQCGSYNCVEKRMKCKLNIKNIDDEGGIFTFKVYVINDNDDETFVKDIEIYVKPRTIGTASWTFTDSSLYTYRCAYDTFHPPEKTVCEKLKKS